jgi:glycogen debranching enzyme
MESAWTLVAGDASALAGVPVAGQDTMTMVEGSSFCLCSSSGDITPGNSHGVFYADTRVLSQWEIEIDDERVEPTQALSAAPYHAMFLGRARARPGHVDSTLLVRRERYIGAGMREDLALVNLGAEATTCTVTIATGCDVADLFEVKSDRIRPARDVRMEANGEELRIVSHSRRRGVRVSAEKAVAAPGVLTFQALVPARRSWRTTIEAAPIVDGAEVTPLFAARAPLEHAAPVRQLRAWQQRVPTVRTREQSLAAVLARSREDLGALRLFDAEHPDDPPSVAAGAPWFMTLFGRDSLIASWMALPLDQSLALGTLRRLARLQGRETNPMNEEEPGRIAHELRSGPQAGPVHQAGAYYGTVDATPLFVMLLGELRRWGAAPETVTELLPAVDRALAWIETDGDPDRDGFVEYQRKTDRGIANQGWKDSFDGINFADGTLARAPIALAEVQGYVYAAYLARARFAREAGDEAATREWTAKAGRLKRAFNDRFWLPDRGYFAVGLDADKRPIDSLASNMGHCLWTGIVDDDKAAAVVERLMSPEMFNGFGVRTLASSMAAYNPMSYHNGSVWPHDGAICAAGLMRYGFETAAQRICLGLLAAATSFAGRLPELFCGFDRGEYPAPVPYPTSCSPQAWAAAAPIHLLRTLLRFDPSVPDGTLRIAPALPDDFGALRVTGLPLAGELITIEVDDGRVDVHDLPPGLELVTDRR